jgi:hypothetical protein
MIYFLNRGLILEKEIVAAIKAYLEFIRFADFYGNYTVSVTNEHPFARLEVSPNPQNEAKSLFPAIVVTTGDDSKTDGLEELQETNDFILEPSDLVPEDDGQTQLEKIFEMISPEIVDELRAAMDAREIKRIFGKSYVIRRQDQISIEIWAENPQLKNELYELIRLFVCGYMMDYLESLYMETFPEFKKDKATPLTLFDSSVHGLRSNNFVFEYGLALSWATITLTPHYIIDQTIIDTDLLEQKENFFMEVLNHVKGYGKITRAWVFGKPDNAPGDGEVGRADNGACAGREQPIDG